MKWKKMQGYQSSLWGFTDKDLEGNTEKYKMQNIENIKEMWDKYKYRGGMKICQKV